MKIIRTALATVALFAATLPATLFAHPAQDLVEEVTGKFMTALESPQAKSDKSFVRTTVDKEVLPHIDFDSMTKLTVGGKAWKSATDDQQVTLVNEFRSFLLNTYTKALDQYSGQTMEFLPYADGSREDRAEVKTLFQDPAANSTIPIDYKLHNKAGPWMIYDIKVEQVSLVLGYKSEFASQIQKGGIEGLIKALKDKNG